jgi:excisionase family DNA binding protein
VKVLLSLVVFNRKWAGLGSPGVLRDWRAARAFYAQPNLQPNARRLALETPRSSCRSVSLGSSRFEYYEKLIHWGATRVDALLEADPVTTTRTTRSITAGTALAPAPREALGVERRAREALSGLEDEAMVEVQISAKAATKALVPVGLLRRYLEAQEIDGRELLVFDSDEEVSSEVAASMLGVSRPHLNELLDIESIPYRRVGNQRRIRVADIRGFRERRERAEAGMRRMADIVNESAGGWTY